MTPLPLIAAAFVLGVLLATAGTPLLPVGVTAGLVALGVLARQWRGLGALALVAAALTAGLVRGQERPAVVPRVRAGVESVGLQGRVLEGCLEEHELARCVVQRDDGARVALRLPRDSCPARPGDRIAAVATLRPVAPDANGARLGSGGALRRRGIVATASAAGCERTGSHPSLLDRLRRVGLWVRARLGEGLARALAPPAERQARALLFGDEAGLDPHDVDAFRESGLAHLLAVSGAHVALLAALLGESVRALLRRVPWCAARGLVTPLAVVVPLPALVLFVLATGESASAVRALVGAVLTALAVLAGRRAHGEAVVAASALITLAVAPSLALDAGWQLSIVASWALAASPREAPSNEQTPSTWWRAVLGYWREALTASARVAVAAAPVLAWHFQRAPASAVLANALAAPLAEAVALPLVLGTGLVGLVLPPLAPWLGRIAAPILDTLFAMPHAALALPFSTLSLPPPTPAQALVLIAVALLVLRASGRARVRGAAVALALVLALELLHLRSARPQGVLRITALDVGQGDAIVIDLPDGEAMLLDAGGSTHEGAPDPGQRSVVPWLADRRRRSLAAVVASHPHPDHIGGLPAVLAWAQVPELWDTRQGERWTQGGRYTQLRAAARARGVTVRGPESLCGPPRPFHGAVLEVLAPCPGVRAGEPANDASFVLRLSFGRASVLLPGDLERGGEARLLRRLGPVTLLKVGHHGSRTSSTPAFLDVLRPQVALVSAGHPSQFDHPHPEVQARFRGRGIPLYSTAEFGAVAVVLRADGRFTVQHGAELEAPP